MTWGRYGFFVVALLVAGSLIAPTTGFSSSTLDRNVDVVAVSDDEAYLGIQRECIESELQVTITNRFSFGTTLDIEIAVNGTARTIDDLGTGGQQTRKFDTFDTNDTITIDASAPDVSIHLERSLPTGCTEKEDENHEEEKEDENHEEEKEDENHEEEKEDKGDEDDEESGEDEEYDEDNSEQNEGEQGDG